MYELKLHYKEIYDSVHGFIKLSNIACLIIDTPQFQRLRYLHQLGTCHYVFPNATHTRFEHSIGTYHLVGEALKHIKINSNQEAIDNSLKNIKELQRYYSVVGITENYLDPFVCELIKIGGLCHDVGHIFFSHVAEDMTIPEIKTLRNENDHELDWHEARSLWILENIIDTNDVLKLCITKDLLQFIKNIIDPQPENKGFVYQLVNNKLNSVDVDKLDYISRDTQSLGLEFGGNFARIIDGMKVINDTICFPEKVSYDIVSLFVTRYRLHKQVYNNKAVIATQLMINGMLVGLDHFVNIYDKIFDINKVTDLTDDYVITMIKHVINEKQHYSDFMNDKDTQIMKNMEVLWDRLNRRKLFKIEEIGVSKDMNEHKKELESALERIGGDKNLLVRNCKIGFVSGEKDNPLNNIYFYKKDTDVANRMKKEDMSVLIPTVYQEYIYMIFNIDM